LPSQEREALSGLRGGTFVPISTESTLVGLLVLGQRRYKLTHWSKDGLPAASYRQLATIIQEALLYHRFKEKYQQSSFAEQPEKAEASSQLEQASRYIAHDLNHILTIILSHAQLLEWEELDPEHATEGLDTQALVKWHTIAICQAALDGAELVRTLSQVWRLPKAQETQGSTESQTGQWNHTLEVNEVIKTTLQMIEPRWRQGRIAPFTRPEEVSSASGSLSSGQPVVEAKTSSEDRKRSAPSLPKGPSPRLVVTLGPTGYISGSPAQLRRVLTNIVSNALDALPPEQGRIEITSGRDGQWAVIKVKDNGTGMSSQARKRMFEPFFTTKGQRGNGLGLSISRSIIARHGGKLEVESQEGKGSTFTILLPLAAPETHS